ncbi:MAG: Tat pathway signal protein [Alphaproteobacteria bacterium]|nr:Tat pathway signal protein [Alphaproteobacteria bacterium]
MWRFVAFIAVVLALGAAPASAQNRFFVVNHSGQQIDEIYVSSSRLQEWGPDILGASVLPAGRDVWVTPIFSDCVLDVRVVYQSGREETRMRVNACSISRIIFGGSGAGAIVGPGPMVVQGNPSFIFINSTGAVIREIYAATSGQVGWGTDRLGANTLGPGGQINIGLPTGMGCLTDVRVVFMNGAVQERRRLETCSVTSLNWR